MWVVRVFDLEGFYDDYYFRKEENARAFLKQKVEEFIQLQINSGYEPYHFGYGHYTYEEMLKDCIKNGGMTDVAYIYKIETED